MADIGARAKAAAAELAFASAERKHAALIGAAEHVWTDRAAIIAANARDMEFGREKGLSGAMLDRLMLDEDRMITGPEAGITRDNASRRRWAWSA